MKYRLKKDIVSPFGDMPKGILSTEAGGSFVFEHNGRCISLMPYEVKAATDWFEKVEEVPFQITADDGSMYVLAYDSECDDKNLTLHIGNYDGNIQELYTHIKKILALRLLKD